MSITSANYLVYNNAHVINPKDYFLMYYKLLLDLIIDDRRV